MQKKKGKGKNVMITLMKQMNVASFVIPFALANP